MSLEPRGCDHFETSINLRDFEGIIVVVGLRNEGSGPCSVFNYEGWNFNSGNYLFTTDTK